MSGENFRLCCQPKPEADDPVARLEVAMERLAEAARAVDVASGRLLEAVAALERACARGEG